MTKIVIILNKAYPSAILSWEPTTKIIIKEEILHCIADFFFPLTAMNIGLTSQK